MVYMLFKDISVPNYTLSLIMPAIRLSISIFLFTLAMQHAFSQGSFSTDSIAWKMHLYELKHPSATLFVHFDKNVYTNNETVWFTGYLLKSSQSALNHTLSVALLDNSDASVVTARYV